MHRCRGRVVILLDEETRIARPVVILNWLEELKTAR
jgi:hypothetical protein